MLRLHLKNWKLEIQILALGWSYLYSISNEPSLLTSTDWINSIIWPSAFWYLLNYFSSVPQFLKFSNWTYIVTLPYQYDIIPFIEPFQYYISLLRLSLKYSNKFMILKCKRKQISIKAGELLFSEMSLNLSRNLVMETRNI